MSLALISACMTDVRLAASQDAIVTSILDRLRTRDPSLRIVDHLRRAIPTAMRLNPLGARRALQIVVAWVQANQGLVLVRRP